MGPLAFVQFSLSSSEGLALPALLGLCSLAGFGLFAIGAEQLFFPADNRLLAFHQFGFAVGELLLSLAKPEPGAAGVVLMLGQLSV